MLERMYIKQAVKIEEVAVELTELDINSALECMAQTQKVLDRCAKRLDEMGM